MRKAIRSFASLVVLVLLIYVLAARMGHPLPLPSQVFKAESQTTTQTLNIPANYEQTWTFAAPAGKSPGVLSGHWMSRGKTAGIRGANDDTLIAFKLTGPNNEILQRQMDHPISGNFRVHCDADGAYAFKFINSGIIRSSAREVTIEAKYQPD